MNEAVRIFKSRWIDADLGGEVIKQRIARPGQGKSELLKRGAFIEVKSE
jgi:hypothetical protein